MRAGRRRRALCIRWRAHVAIWHGRAGATSLRNYGARARARDQPSLRGCSSLPDHVVEILLRSRYQDATFESCDSITIWLTWEPCKLLSPRVARRYATRVCVRTVSLCNTQRKELARLSSQPNCNGETLCALTRVLRMPRQPLAGSSPSTRSTPTIYRRGTGHASWKGKHADQSKSLSDQLSDIFRCPSLL